jgi:hypothetical protein
MGTFAIASRLTLRLDVPGYFDYTRLSLSVAFRIGRTGGERRPPALLWRLVVVAVGDLAQDVVHDLP